MRPSLIRLAEKLDSLALLQSALITESDDKVVVAQLTEANAKAILGLIKPLGWSHVIEDASPSEIHESEIAPEFGPFRIIAAKPPRLENVNLLLTNAGFGDFLARPLAVSIVHVARLTSAFETFAARFGPWDDPASFEPIDVGSDPRKVVREASERRVVPSDLSPWLLREGSAVDLSNAATAVWANRACNQLFNALANELEGDNVLMFKGPPVVRFERGRDLAVELGQQGFDTIQKCAYWVFGSPLEMETRHALFTAELARFNIGSRSAASLFRQASSPSLEGAKIAFQLGLSKISADSLKAMSDVRKAVADEASKLSDATRQLATAVTGALFGGIGLIAARLTITLNTAPISIAIFAIGLVLFFYVLVIILSGWQFVGIQRSLRELWRDKLYRFLPDEEYAHLVAGPAKKAETAFDNAAYVSICLAFVLLLAVSLISWKPMMESLGFGATVLPSTSNTSAESVTIPANKPPEANKSDTN